MQNTVPNIIDDISMVKVLLTFVCLFPLYLFIFMWQTLGIKNSRLVLLELQIFISIY